MYRELIAGYIAHIASAKLQDPCTEAEIANAEEYVGYPFPEELRALLRETNGDCWLLMSAEQIINKVKLNREILAEAFDDIVKFNEKVDRHIFFATNGCGDCYCYRVMPSGEVDTTAIYMWDHETFDHYIVAKDIPDLIRKYYNDEV